MNLKGRLKHIGQALIMSRQYGKTHTLAKACKELDGVFIASSFKQAKDLEKKYKITCKSIDVNLNGLHGPFFIDHDATSKLLLRAVSKIEQLEKENYKLHNKLNKLKEVLDE